MRDEEKDRQQAPEGQTGDSSQQTDDQTGAHGGETSLTQPSTDDSLSKEDERTGEGTGARAGEYN